MMQRVFGPTGTGVYLSYWEGKVLPVDDILQFGPSVCYLVL
jgi:hypothetical protein